MEQNRFFIRVPTLTKQKNFKTFQELFKDQKYFSRMNMHHK